MILLSTFADWGSFLGRFHPIMVHFPIGFLMLILILEIGIYFKKFYINDAIIGFIWVVTLLSAILSSGLGLLLAEEGGYSENLLFEHRNQGIILSILVFITYLIHRKILFPKLSTFIYFPLLIACTLLLFVTGHRGGKLTHGEEFLTENTPQPFRNWLGIAEKKQELTASKPQPIANLNEANVFEDLISPILQEKCQNCHGKSKMKGKLRLDTFENFLKGGEHGKIFEAGNADKSKFIQLIMLDENHDDHMPPKGKPQITENELVLLKWWVENGASSTKKVSELPQPDKVKSVLAQFGAVSINKPTADTLSIKQVSFDVENSLLNQKKTPIPPAVKHEIETIKGLVLPLSKENNWIELSFVNNSSLNDAQLTFLPKINEQLLWLRLSSTKITDNGLKIVAQQKNLTRLFIDNTSVSDRGLQELADLQNLEYLNLNRTLITDASIPTIGKLKNLKKLYVWNTKLTENGLKTLQTLLPNLSIEKGLNEKEVDEFLKISKK